MVLRCEQRQHLAGREHIEDLRQLVLWGGDRADGHGGESEREQRGDGNPVTIHARKTTAAFAPVAYEDMFFDDVKTLYTLGDPDTHTTEVEQIYSDYRKGPRARLDSLQYLALQDLKVIDLDTAKVLEATRQGPNTSVPLEVPIVDDKQNAHRKITSKFKDEAERAG